MRWLTRFAIALLFLAAASALWWLDTVGRPEPERAPGVAAERLPDYYLTGFRIHRYQGSGAPRQTLTGSRLDHFPGTDTADVTGPRVDYRPAGAPAWRMRAEHGTLAQRTDLLELDGDVRLHRPATADSSELLLLTPQLTYDLNAEIAHTERPVRLLSPGSRLDATGMTARLAEQRVQFHHDVRARHDPALAAPGDADG